MEVTVSMKVTSAGTRRQAAARGRIVSRLARVGASRANACSRQRWANTDALAIVCAPAAIHRGYRVTVVLDRLDVADPWSGKATIASTTSPSRCLATLHLTGLSRAAAGTRAREAMLRIAMARIDEVESASHGVWPVAGEPG